MYVQYNMAPTKVQPSVRAEWKKQMKRDHPAMTEYFMDLLIDVYEADPDWATNYKRERARREKSGKHHFEAPKVTAEFAGIEVDECPPPLPMPIAENIVEAN